ncbi:hypothetical protein CL634_08235, partial [bacterium]|nr:hypothetical protein [bacterium]
EIYSIDSFGEEEVYDLTVPETANFFANGLCVHNSKLMLDNLGIMVDTNKSYKDYAVSIGKTTSQLTDQERKTAFVNAAMEEANSLVAQLGEEQLTTKDSINQVVTAAGDLAIKFGDVLGPAVRDVAGFLTDLLENTQAFLEWADGVNTAEEAQKQLDEEFIKTKSLISDVSEQFGLTTDSSKTLIGQMRDLKDELAIMSEDDFLQGRINPAINAQFRLGEQMRLTSTAMKDQIENTIQLTPVYTEVTDIASEYLNTLEKIPIVSEDVSKAQQDAIDDALKLEKQRKQEARNFVSNMQTMGKAYPEMEKAGKRAAQVQALVDAYAGANAAYKAMAGIAFVGPALGIAAAAAALGAGLANVKMIEKAATGADFVTSGPQMLMVGDNPGGREQVSVTPLSSPNIEGPQGGNPITLNISAPLLDDTVVDSIIPALREAIRRGESIGIV